MEKQTGKNKPAPTTNVTSPTGFQVQDIQHYDGAMPRMRQVTEVLTIAVTRTEANVQQSLIKQEAALEGLYKFMTENADKLYVSTPHGDIPFAWLQPTFNPVNLKTMAADKAKALIQKDKKGAKKKSNAQGTTEFKGVS